MQVKVKRYKRSLITLAATALAALLCVALLAGCASGTSSSAGSGTNSGANANTNGGGAANSNGSTAANSGSSIPNPKAQIIKAGQSLKIPASEITDKAQFYPVVVDGTNMEVIAVKAPDGTVRTAFNTCQVCYDSGRGYYEQVGSNLVCQNCGNQFAMNRVEVEAGGCNPWPIFAEDKTVSKTAIAISYDFLSSSKDAFANWKSDY